MKNYLIATALAVVTAFACVGCKTSGDTNDPAPTAQTSVLGIEQNYNHALAIGAWYGQLADCTEQPAEKPLCSTDEVRTKIKQAKDVAGPVVAGARATVRNPLFDQSTASAITLSAQNAVAVLTAITAPLEALLNQAIQQGKAKPLGASMQASPAPLPLPRANTADLSVMGFLALLNLLLKVLPEGTAQWLKIKADRDKFNQIKAEGRNPTDQEWQDVIDVTTALEAQIDANAARGHTG
jgi:hypothetical protein